MPSLVSVVFATALLSSSPVALASEVFIGSDYVALASCPDRAAGAGGRVAGELGQSAMDKDSTMRAADLLKEYLDFHDQAQAATGVRAALMPWSNLATHAN